jgi:hypothetical protein
MTARRTAVVRVGLALAVAAAMAACTPGGQFDPTEMLSSDVFSSKKKLPGEREPVFPNGVPGAETGVPPDLVKGYQPPPGAEDADSAAQPVMVGGDKPRPRSGASAEAKPKSKPKPKPKPAVAQSTHQPAHDPAFDRAPAGNPGGQAAFPNPSGGGGAPQAQGSQPNWPAPPATGTSSR